MFRILLAVSMLSAMSAGAFKLFNQPRPSAHPAVVASCCLPPPCPPACPPDMGLASNK